MVSAGRVCIVLSVQLIPIIVMLQHLACEKPFRFNQIQPIQVLCDLMFVILGCPFSSLSPSPVIAEVILINSYEECAQAALMLPIRHLVEKGRGDVQQTQDMTFWRDACTQAIFRSPYSALRCLDGQLKDSEVQHPVLVPGKMQSDRPRFLSSFVQLRFLILLLSLLDWSNEYIYVYWIERITCEVHIAKNHDMNQGRMQGFLAGEGTHQRLK